MKTSLYILILLSLSVNSYSKPLSGEVIFSNPEVYSFKISPDSRHLVGQVADDEEMTLELVDTASLLSREILAIDNKGKARIEDYSWIDNDTVYAEYRFFNGQKEQVLIDVGKNLDDSKSLRFHTIKMKGKIIDPLINREDEVLFSREKRTGIGVKDVLYASKKNLVEDQIDGAKKYPHLLRNAVGYVADQQQIRLAVTVENEKLQLHYLDENNNWRMFYQLEDFKNTFVPIGFIDKTTLAVVSDLTTDKKALVEFNLTDRTFGDVIYEHEKYDLVDAALDNGHLEYVEYLQFGELQTEYFFDGDERISNLLKRKFVDKQIKIVSDVGSEYKVVLVFASNDPGAFYLFNDKTLVAGDLGKRYPEIDNNDLSPTVSFSHSGQEGMEIESILTLPKIRNGMLMVRPHGGPVGVRDYNFYNPYNQYFASRGFAVLNVNFRGSTGFGRIFKESGKGEFGKKIEEDISLVVDDVLKKYNFKKVCAIGSSYGAYSSMMLALTHPDTYDCVVGMYGIYDLMLEFNASNIKLRDEYRQFVSEVIGDYDESLKTVSPFYIVKNMNQPVFLIAGRQDRVAEFEHTNRMNYILKKRGVNVEFLQYNNVGHGHTEWRGEIHQQAEIMEFLRKNFSDDLPSISSAYDALAGEYVAIADAYEFSQGVEKDLDKAIKYYFKASEFEHPRSLYNIASRYHFANGVDQDINLAINYYKKAFKVGYDNAANRLMDIYLDNEYAERSIKDALPYIDHAIEEGVDRAKIEKAKLLYSGEEVENDIVAALDLLSTVNWNAVDNREHAHVLLSELDNEKFLFNSGNELGKVFSGLNKEASEYKFKVEDIGSYKIDGNSRRYFDKGVNIRSESATHFGVAFRLNVKDVYFKYIKRNELFTVLRARWTPLDNKNASVQENIVYVNKVFRGEVLFEIKQRPANQSRWKLEIFTLDDKTIFEKTFTLYPSNL